MDSIRLTDVRPNVNAIKYANVVLGTGKLSQGGFVRALEAGLASVSGTNYAAAVSSGTAALYLALIAAGVEDGDRVVVPAFTFAATASAVKMVGAHPVFCDIGDDWLMDVEQARALADEYDAKAVVPVHLFGARVDIAALDGLNVVEDAAQAIGHKIGYGAISLYGSKTIGCGEGGMVVGDDAERFAWIMAARNQGMAARYQFVLPGFNFRLTDLQAAVAVGQFVDLSAILAMRTMHADLLWQELHDLPVTLPNPFGHTWHQFVIEVDNRDDFRAHLEAAGIETAVHYPQALPDIYFFPDADVPNARRAAARVVSLPIHEHLTNEQMRYVAATAREAVQRCVV